MFEYILWAAILPGLIAAGVAYLLKQKLSPWAAPASLGCGYFAAHLALHGLPSAPMESLDWAFLSGSAGLVLFTVEDRFRLGSNLRALLKMLVLGLMLWGLLMPFFDRWEALRFSLILFVLSSFILTSWGFLEHGSEEMHVSRFLASFCLLFSGLAFTLLLGGFATGAKLSGAHASALGGLFAVALLRGKLVLGKGALAFLISGFFMLLGSGYFFAEIPLGITLLHFLGLGSLWVLPLALSKSSAARHGWLPVGVAGLCSGMALIWAFLVFAE